jgi:hypothetical protein
VERVYLCYRKFLGASSNVGDPSRCLDNLSRFADDNVEHKAEHIGSGQELRSIQISEGRQSFEHLNQAIRGFDVFEPIPFTLFAPSTELSLLPTNSSPPAVLANAEMT